MGGQLSSPAPNPYARRGTDAEKPYQQTEREVYADLVASQVSEEARILDESRNLYRLFQSSSEDEFYDGIPQYKRSSYQRSRSLNAIKVSDTGPHLGRTSSKGGRKTEILSSLGRSVSSFASMDVVASGSTKNNKISIIAFEVANTIVKGSNLMQSLSKESIHRLKEVVLAGEGFLRLISSDRDELLKIFASDKREELKCFSSEVVRFGNQCRDPQWHSLDKFFEKYSGRRTPPKQLKEAAEIAIMQLMAYVQQTSELYEKMQILDRMEDAYKLKRLAKQLGARDNGVNVLQVQLKLHKKVVEKLKKNSLWSRYMEEIMGKLVDIVLYLNQEINSTFGDPEATIEDNRMLGPAGLALHYANIILKIDSIVVNPSSMNLNYRETLYRNLPPSLKHPLRSALQAFHIDKELTVAEIKDKMEATLCWLAVFAMNTAKAHHGFGWVGESMNKGREEKQGLSGKMEIERIETLHYADKLKTETYIMELLVWLNYLVSRSKPVSDGAEPKSMAVSGNENQESSRKVN